MMRSSYFPPPFTGGDSGSVFADREAVEGASAERPLCLAALDTSPVNGGGKV
jgi:hypothetical protein